MATEQNIIGREISHAASRAIYEDALQAHEDASHPCHRFVELQHGVDADRWQMPIPFMGSTAALSLVFLGLNPGYDPNENSPRWGISFEQWDRFWRTAFDQAPATWPRLYRWYQRIGQRALGDDFRLGRDALVLEVIHYRSWRSEGCDEADVMRHEMPVTLPLLDQIQSKCDSLLRVKSAVAIA